MLTGDNGVLQKTVESKEKSERAEIVEKVKLDILGEIAGKEGNNLTEDELKTILSNYFNDIPEKLPEDLSTSTEELTSKIGNHKIQISELYTGKLLKHPIVAGLYNADNNELIYTWENMLKLGNIINDNNGTIGRNAFNVGDIKVKLVIKDGITGISNLAGISQLVEIQLPESITYINDGAFSGDKNLKRVNIPNGVTTFPACITGLSGLEELEIGNGVSSVPVLEDLKKLKVLKLGDGITSIPTTFCKDIETLETLALGKNIQSIGIDAFHGCKKLTDFSFDESLENLGKYAFAGCTSLINLYLPDNLTSISPSSFAGCSNIQLIKFGDNTENIEETAFSGCSSLKLIWLPKTLQTISYGAFGSCDSLSTVLYEGNQTEWNRINILDGNTALNVDKGISYRCHKSRILILNKTTVAKEKSVITLKL